MPGGIVPSVSVYLQWLQIGDPEHPYRRPWDLGYISIFLGILSTAAVAGRLVARLLILRNSAIDDVIIVLALVCPAHLPCVSC